MKSKKQNPDKAADKKLIKSMIGGLATSGMKGERGKDKKKAMKK